MKRVSACAFVLFLVSLAASAQQRRPVILWLTGSGTATESDRGSADSEALDQATNQVNSICTGDVETVEKTGDNCITIGGGEGNSPTYTCMVLVKAKCVIRGR